MSIVTPGRECWRYPLSHATAAPSRWFVGCATDKTITRTAAQTDTSGAQSESVVGVLRFLALQRR